MDKNLLVQIIVPVKGNKWEVGTGYPVAKDCILTAHHILFPGQRDKNRQIEIRWYHLSGAAKEWQPIKDGCLWRGDEKTDVAIINHPFPDEVSEWGILSENKPTTDKEWESRGFASAGKLDNDNQEPVDLKGKTYSMADDDTSFKLGVDDKVKKEEYWKGASGSPVFVNHVILGVIVSCPPTFNASRFRATPTWQLLKQDSFRKEIGYDERKNILENTKKRLVKILANSTIVQNELSNQLKHSITGGMVDVEKLADQLLSSSFEYLLKACNSTIEEMCEEANQQQDILVIVEVINEILPIMFGRGIIERVKDHISEANAPIISLPINTDTAAEIIMAGFDKRKTDFKELPENQLLPEGKYALPLVPEGGNDKTQGQFEKDFHKQMRAFAGAELLQQYASVDESTIIRAAAQELEYLSTEKARTHYILCRKSKGYSEKNDLVRKMKKDYPALIFIELRDDVELLLKERKLLRPLKDIFTSKVEKKNEIS